MRAELVFRYIPGKLVQWSRQTEHFRRWWRLRRAPVKPPVDGITQVPVAPTRQRLPPPRELTFRPGAGALTESYSCIRSEPPAADRAWSLPGLWHRDDPSSSSRAGDRSVQNAWVTFGEYGQVSFAERRRLSANTVLPDLRQHRKDRNRH